MSNGKSADNFYKRRKKVLNLAKSSVQFQEYQVYLQELLANERVEYEENTATEFARGRVSMLKQLIDELKNGVK